MKVGMHKNWTLFFIKDSIMAYTNIGDKTMIVFYNEKDKGIKCSVQIHDKNSRVYYTHIENGKLVERSFECSKEKNELTTKDLKEYVAVIYTLPEKLKASVAPLF